MNLHQRRLENSCKVLEIAAPNLREILENFEGREDVKLKVEILEEKNQNKKERNLTTKTKNFYKIKVSDENIPKWDGNFIYDKTWKVGFVNLERENPEVKNSDTSVKDAARIASGCDEILLVNRAGEITEGSITNVFFVKGSVLVTPRARILKGIAREVILDAAKELGIYVKERAILKSEFDNGVFDGIFLCNSIRGIIPAVFSFDKYSFFSGEKLNSIISKLTKNIEEKIRKNYWNS